MKSNPKPARIAPSDRVLPFAISQRKAPIPSMGNAAREIRSPKPKIATSHAVEVVPNVAPTMTPTACEKVTNPALTKPMTVSVAAVEDWIATVKSAPDTTALNRPATSLWSAPRSEVTRETFEAFGEMMDPE